MSSSGYLVQEVERTVAGDFVDPSAFCDSNHPRVRALAHRLTMHCSNDVDRVATLLKWVREEIDHRASPFPQAASDTLSIRSGTCSNRANLLVAMLRALDIPAGFHLLQMQSRDCFGLLESPVFDPFPDDSLHLFCAVLLDDKWVKCDPSKWHLMMKSSIGE